MTSPRLYLKMKTKSWQTSPPSRFYRLLGLILSYAFWVILVRLLTLTFITYFTISPTTRFQDISDAFSSNEVSLMGLASLFFVILSCKLNPLTSTKTKEVISQEKFEKNFIPGFIQGIFFAFGIILAFLFNGTYRYLGYFIQLNEAPLELANILMRMMALAMLAYCEEFLFHYKIQRDLSGVLPDFVAASVIAVIYCSIKMLQFDLGTMHLMTLFLVSVTLFYRTRNEGRFAKGAGFWSAILILFQPLLSLPIFGNHFSGILLIKYESTRDLDSSRSAIRFLTGGAGGPLSSFTFQLLLILDIARSILKKKNRKVR